jgi:biotin transport system substrate-specific component
MRITTKEMILASLFTAFIIISGFIAIPLPFSPVPLTAQTFAIMLVGMIFGPKLVLMSTGTYVALGAVGLPVFSGFRGGISVLLGPSGGYIVGFVVGAVVISILKGNGENLYRVLLSGVIGGILVIHAMGVPWLAFQLGIPLKQAALAGSVPYLIGDGIKLLLAGVLAVQLNGKVGVLKSAK